MAKRSPSRGRSSEHSFGRSPGQQRSNSVSDKRYRSFSRHDSHSRSPHPRNEHRRDRRRYSRVRNLSDERPASHFRKQSPDAPRSSKVTKTRPRRREPLEKWLTPEQIVVEKLTKNVQEGHLREIFGSYGPVEDIDLPVNRQFMTNRGSAYIVFESPSDAELAISHMHEAQLDGAVISVSSVLPRRRASPSPPPARRSPPPYEERDGPSRSSRHGWESPPGYPRRPKDKYASPQSRYRSPPRRRGGRGRGRGRGRADRMDEYRPRSYSRSRSPRRRRSPSYDDRSLSRSRSRSRSLTPPPRRSRRKGSPPPRHGRRRSYSYSSYSSYSRSRTRSRSRSTDRYGRRR